MAGYSLSYPALRLHLLNFIEALPPDLDPSPVITAVPGDALHRILARTTWLSANRSEVDIMTAGASDGARPLLARMGQDARGVVLRAGARGCRVFLKDGACADLPGFEVDVVDTNGAGDTHAGAFVGALATGADPGQAALYANAAAAISVTREGGATAPDARTIRAFLSQRGHKTIRQDRTSQTANH